VPMLVPMTTVLALIFVNSRVGYELADLGIEARLSAGIYDLSLSRTPTPDLGPV
jgi:hypothetical protein